jgi:proliferating cell nuclear antigen
MKAVFKDAVVFKNIIAIIRDAVTSSRLVFSPTGVTMSAMDSSHISMVNLQLGLDMFTTYECEEVFNVDMDLKNLFIAISLVTKGSILGMGSDPKKPDRIHVEINTVGSTKTIDDGGVKRKVKGANKEYSFELKLMDIDVDIFEIPDELPCGWRVVVDNTDGILGTNIGKFSEFGDCTKLGCDGKELFIESDGDVGEAIVRIEAECEWWGGTDNEEPRPLKSSLNSRMVKIYSSGRNICKDIHLFIGGDNPTMIQYKLYPQSTMNMYIAPRVMDD